MRAGLLLSLAGAMLAATAWFAAGSSPGSPAAQQIASRGDEAGALGPRYAASPPADHREAVAVEVTTPRAVPTPPTPRPTLLTISGAVFRADGRPATAAQVTLGGQRTHSDTQGRFVLRCSTWPDPSAALIAWEEGAAPAIQARFGVGLGAHRAGTELGPVQLQLGAMLGALAGRVVDASGTPQKGWRLRVEREEPPDQSTGTRRSIDALIAGTAAVSTSRKDGRFELRAVRPGPCVLIAQRGRKRVETALCVPSDGLTALRVVVD